MVMYCLCVRRTVHQSVVYGQSLLRSSSRLSRYNVSLVVAVVREGLITVDTRGIRLT